MDKTVSINEELCLGCGICVEICPQHILYLDDSADTARVSRQSKCDRKRGCERVCPAGAIKIH
ncbi:ferredoxin family protein [Chloroflexota bacterium]